MCNFFQSENNGLFSCKGYSPSFLIIQNNLFDFSYHPGDIFEKESLSTDGKQFDQDQEIG
jgi:hypothetical protein